MHTVPDFHKLEKLDSEMQVMRLMRLWKVHWPAKICAENVKMKETP